MVLPSRFRVESHARARSRWVVVRQGAAFDWGRKGSVRTGTGCNGSASRNGRLKPVPNEAFGRLTAFHGVAELLYAACPLSRSSC